MVKTRLFRPILDSSINLQEEKKYQLRQTNDLENVGLAMIGEGCLSVILTHCASGLVTL